MNGFRVFVAVALWIAQLFSAHAQEVTPINTERPSFSASPLVLGTELWQTEFGIQFAQLDSNADATTLPQLLVRYGVASDLELQFEWSGLLDIDSPGFSDSGLTDARLNAKWQLSSESDRTQFGLLFGVSLPIGDDQFSTDSYDPRLGLLWTHSGDLNWFGTAAYTEVGDTYVFGNGIGLAFTVNDTNSWFVEHEMEIPENGSTLHRLNAGWAFLNDVDRQFDLNASVGLNDHAPDYALGVGMAIRFR